MEGKDTYEDLEDILTKMKAAEDAAAAPRRAAMQGRMLAEIEADKARIESEDIFTEGARILAEEKANREAQEVARRERGRVERVRVEMRKIAAAQTVVLTEIIDPDLMAWRGPQVDLWNRAP